MSMSTGRGAEPAIGRALRARDHSLLQDVDRDDLWPDELLAGLETQAQPAGDGLVRLGSSVGTVDTERWRRGSKSSPSCWNGSTPWR